MPDPPIQQGPGTDTYSLSDISGAMSETGDCWTQISSDPDTGNFEDKCTDENAGPPCVLEFNLTAGGHVKYTFLCSTNAANAGGVEKTGGGAQNPTVRVKTWATKQVFPP